MPQKQTKPIPFLELDRVRKGLLPLSVLTIGILLMSPLLVTAATPTDEAFTVAFIGDSGYGTGFEYVLSLIQTEGADAVVHLGDFDYNDDPAGFFEVINTNLGGFSLFPCSRQP